MQYRQQSRKHLAEYDPALDIRPAFLPPLSLPTDFEKFAAHLDDLRHSPMYECADRQARQLHQPYIRRMESIEGAHLVDNSFRKQIREAVQDELEKHAQRVEAERALADYIGDIADQETYYDAQQKLHALSYSLRFCHHSGCLGLRPSGDRVIAWDHKCEKVRLCPHESREETQRLAEHYLPGITEWLNDGVGRRVFYTVLNPPNIDEGDLAQGKRDVFELTKAWLSHEAEACPLVWKHGRAVKTQPFSMAKACAGSLVTQEDPLGSTNGWNVHSNVLMLVQGQFDYHLARAWWCELVGRKDAQLNFDQVDPDNLTKAILEIVKYSTRIVPEKSEDGQGAPAMTRWPPHLWLEWWDAQQRFRRTRSYGCLYAIDRKRWNAASESLREAQWLKQARLRGHPLDKALAALEWCDMDEKTRGIIRDVMRRPEVLDLADVLWMGRVDYLDDVGAFWVDVSAPFADKAVGSTPGDNFRGSGLKSGNNSGAPPPI